MRRVNLKDVKWEREGVLYRGNFQANLEEQLLRDWANGLEDKAGYIGGASEGNSKLTFVTPRINDAFFYCDYRARKKLHKKGTNYYSSFSSSNPFTIYPVVMAINAKKYREKLYVPNQGEDLCIEGKIFHKDIVPVFGFGFDKTDLFTDDKKKTEIMKEELLSKLGEYDISERSFLKRYEEEGTGMYFLLNYLYELNFEGHTSTQKRKAKEAVEKLRDFFQKTDFS